MTIVVGTESLECSLVRVAQARDSVSYCLIRVGVVLGPGLSATEPAISPERDVARAAARLTCPVARRLLCEPLWSRIKLKMWLLDVTELALFTLTAGRRPPPGTGASWSGSAGRKQRRAWAGWAGRDGWAGPEWGTAGAS